LAQEESKQSWYLRQKGTRDFWRTTTTTTKDSFQKRAILQRNLVLERFN
jgi:hypothetical protein